MLNPLPLSQWLSAPRPDNTPVAWQDDRLWTLGDLRHDVTQLVDTLRREDGERWALCIENGYLFIVALLAIKVFLELIKRISFVSFAIYRFIVAAAVYAIFM